MVPYVRAIITQTTITEDMADMVVSLVMVDITLLLLGLSSTISNFLRNHKRFKFKKTFQESQTSLTLHIMGSSVTYLSWGVGGWVDSTPLLR